MLGSLPVWSIGYLGTMCSPKVGSEYANQFSSPQSHGPVYLILVIHGNMQGDVGRWCCHEHDRGTSGF